MIARKKSKNGLRYLASAEALSIGKIVTVDSGPATGQRVRPIASLSGRLDGPDHYYDFEAEQGSQWFPANPQASGICPDCGEPRVLCECGTDGF